MSVAAASKGRTYTAFYQGETRTSEHRVNHAGAIEAI